MWQLQWRPGTLWALRVTENGSRLQAGAMYVHEASNCAQVIFAMDVQTRDYDRFAQSLLWSTLQAMDDKGNPPTVCVNEGDTIALKILKAASLPAECNPTVVTIVFDLFRSVHAALEHKHSQAPETVA